MPPGRTGRTATEIGSKIGDKFEAALKIPAFERAFDKMAADFDLLARPFQNFRAALDKATKGFEDQTARLQELKVQSTTGVLSRQVALDRALAQAQKKYDRSYQVEQGRQAGGEGGQALGGFFGQKGAELGKKVGAAFGEIAARSDWLIRGFRDLASEAVVAAKSLIGIGTVVGIVHQASSHTGGLSTLQKSWELVLGEIGILFIPMILKASKALQDFATDIRQRGLVGAVMNLPPGVKAAGGAYAGYKVAGLPGAAVGGTAGLLGGDATGTAIVVGAGGVAIALARAQSAIATAGGSLAAYLPTLGPALAIALTAAVSFVYTKSAVEENMRNQLIREQRERLRQLRTPLGRKAHHAAYRRYEEGYPSSRDKPVSDAERDRANEAYNRMMEFGPNDPRRLRRQGAPAGTAGGSAGKGATTAGGAAGKGGLATDILPPGYQAHYQNFADVRREMQVKALGMTGLNQKMFELQQRMYEELQKQTAAMNNKVPQLPAR